MKYEFDSPLLVGVIRSRPNRFIMEVEVEGRSIRCHCPSTGRIGGIVFRDVPCLLSKSESEKRKTSCTVEAISLDPIEKKNRDWIGINQNAANRYLEFFLMRGMLPRIARGDVRREVKLGNSRIDFRVGKTYIEVKTPLIMLPARRHLIYARPHKFNSFERLIKHFSDLTEHLGETTRAILLLCYLYEAEPFKPPPVDESNAKIIKAARTASAKGLENWQVNLKIDKKGVSLARYFKLNLF
jgi:sugar fermentation stimulation protein A